MTIMTTGTFARIQASALACFLATATMSSALAQDANKERTQDDFNTIDAGQLPVTFPFREIASHVVVDVAFGEDEPLPFMFDTGAASFVTAEIAQAHGGEVLGRVPGVAGGNKVIENALQTYPAVTVAGSVEIREFMALEPWAVDNSLLHCVTPHGLLGEGRRQALARRVWHLRCGYRPDLRRRAQLRKRRLCGGGHCKGPRLVIYHHQTGLRHPDFDEQPISTIISRLPTRE
jgi:hypothetical protein